MADTRLRKAERDFYSNPTIENLLAFWRELQRTQNQIDLTIIPSHLFQNQELQQFLMLGEAAWQQCSLFGLRLELLFKKLYLICHNILFLTGWAPPGEQVEGSSQALTGLDLRRAYWLPDTSGKTGRFICHMGHNHAMTIAIAYTAIQSFFLPLIRCPHCHLDINIIDAMIRLERVRPDPRLLLRTYPNNASTITIETDCLDDEYIVNHEHETSLLSLTRDPSTSWLTLPLPIVYDVRISEGRFAEIPGANLQTALELPGLEGNGLAYFIE